MTLKILFLAVFAGSLALLVYQIAAARARRRNGEPTPSYAAGNIPGSLAMVVMSGSNLIDLSEPVRLTAAIISILLLAMDIGTYARALRRESRRGT